MHALQMIIYVQKIQWNLQIVKIKAIIVKIGMPLKNHKIHQNLYLKNFKNVQMNVIINLGKANIWIKKINVIQNALKIN